jgi:hypothetical protein
VVLGDVVVVVDKGLVLTVVKTISRLEEGVTAVYVVSRGGFREDEYTDEVEMRFVAY